jgi:NTP pyrophosphatase (non-canonical NTP hydrolase)
VTAGPYSIGSDNLPGLSKLVEELGELQDATGRLQAILGKLIATGGSPEHWSGLDLRQALLDELGDVDAAVSFFIERNCNGPERSHIRRRSVTKRNLFNKWHLEQG